MGKIISLGLFMYGVVSILFQWIQSQKARQSRVDACILFLQKSLYAMESEKMRLIPYFTGYQKRSDGFDIQR